MRATTLFCLSMALLLTGNAQEKFVAPDYTRYYNWFHQQAQTELLYTPSAQLVIFEYETPIHEAPCEEAAILSKLEIGQQVTNLLYPNPEEDQIKGYDDLWYFVEALNNKGGKIKGYVWGGNIARGWRTADVAEAPGKETILLGISSRPRINPSEIKAEIRVLNGLQLLAQQQVDDLCVFEECASSVLLRVIEMPKHPNMTIIETATVTVGCEVGIYKQMFHWDGLQLQQVMSGEFAFQPHRSSRPFRLSKEKMCQYDGEDEYFNPVWKCWSLSETPGQKKLIKVK